MPKVSFGVHPTGEDGVPFDDPGVLVAHHFLGSWKSRKGWNSAKKGVGDYITLFFTSLGLGKSGLEEYRAQLSRADPFYAMPKVNERAGYPVSAAFDPPRSRGKGTSGDARGRTCRASVSGGRRAGGS